MTTRSRAAEILGGAPPTAPLPETCTLCVHRAMATERVSTPETDPHHRPGTIFAFCHVRNDETPHDFDCADFERRTP